jgi:hypothetical protein
MNLSIARQPALGLVAALLLLGPCRARAQGQPDDRAELKKQLDELMKQNAELQKKLEDIQKRLDALPPAPAQTPPAPQAPAAPQPPQPGAPQPAEPPKIEPSQPAAGPKKELSPQEALDAAVASLQGPSTMPPAQGGQPIKEVAGLKLGNATLKLIDVALIVDVAAGWSSVNDASLLTLEGGDHDPRKRGFTLQAAELGLAGAVDPYFTAAANINFNIDSATGDSNVELEEAYATSSSLPYGLQVKAGLYFTEFGIVNATHPHVWDWMDQPVIMTRVFGGDGQRAPGARVAWLMPFVPWYSQIIVGAQNANGSTMPSFLSNGGEFDQRPIGNRPFVGQDVSGLGDLAWSARWENSFELTKETTVKFGFSGVTGPNATGPDARTNIYGADLKLKWRAADNERGWPFVIWQTELVRRDYDAAAFVDPANPANNLAATTLHDWGLYSQVLWGFHLDWALGMRYEYASGSGESVGGRSNDPFRDDRQRFSPLLVWQLSEFSRLRLQYNHDIADHLDHDADSIFFGLEVLIGAHPPHSY